MESKLLTTDTLKLYQQRFEKYIPPKKVMSQRDKEVVDVALKRFGMWVETYEQRLFVEREVNKKKEAEKSPMDVAVGEQQPQMSEEEQKKLRKEVDEGLRTILALNSWYECLIWAQSRNSSRQIRRDTYQKLMKGGFYNKAVQTTIHDAVNRLSLI